MDTKIKLTGLWKHTSRSGQVFSTGNLGAGRLLAFQNGYKTNEKEPDLLLYLAPADRQSEGTKVAKQPDPAFGGEDFPG